MENRNLILSTDSYKTSHFLQYPEGTRYVSSYIEARRSGVDSEVVHFGLQMYLKDKLSKPITKEDIDEAEDYINAHGEPFNRAGWEHILNKHGGYMPVRIQALPEGKVVPLRTPQVQVINTDPEVPWITNYLETAILRATWYPSTVASVSRKTKKIIYRYLELTSDNPDVQIPFKLHDFGARGCTSSEQAMIGGVSHLINFMGTDTLEALIAARRYYKENMAGYSIPAAEHSTIMTWEKESDAFENMIEKFSGENRLYAVVSDTYSIDNAVDNIWGKELRDKVKETGGTLVVRPDSGDPVTVVERVVTSLSNSFGYTVNSKGYKVLDNSVRVIQSDGVTYETIDFILANLKTKGFSADNIAFGMGAGLLQKCNRDTFGYAMKASAVDVNGVWRDIKKSPQTDPSKESKAGIQHNEDFCLVYENGQVLKEWTLTEARENAKLKM